MESLWSGEESYTGEVVLCFELVKDCRTHTSQIYGTFILLYFGTPHHGHTLITYNHVNTLICELVESTKISRRGLPNTSPEKKILVRVIYTACCCSASNLAFHAFQRCKKLWFGSGLGGRLHEVA